MTHLKFAAYEMHSKESFNEHVRESLQERFKERLEVHFQMSFCAGNEAKLFYGIGVT